MGSISPWPMIHQERQALLEDLRLLSGEQWSTRSLCAQWSVREVFAHMIATAAMTPPKFLAGFARAGFRFDKMNAANAEAHVGTSPAAQLVAYEALLGASTHPPGPIDAMLGEAIVHGEDIRRPLGIPRTYPTGAVTRAADFYHSSNLLIGSKTRIAGLRLAATDADWSTGTGPLVRGPALSLLLAMTGRTAALDDLDGAGLTVLRDRA